MKKLVGTAFVLAALVGMTLPSFAACRPGTNYSCYQTYNGKMNCGCR